MLFLAFSGWSTELVDFSTFSFSVLFFDFSFSLRSTLGLDFSVLVLGRECSGTSVLDLDFSLQSVLTRPFASPSVNDPGTIFKRPDFSTADMNFLRCRIYSGYNSKSQWFPPLIHNGSYFSTHNSHNCLP